jgi:hypothetical protein
MGAYESPYGTSGVFRSYTITASTTAGGTISPPGVTYVPAGGTQTFTMAETTANLTDVLVNGNSIGATNQYLFVNVTNNQTIAAVYSGYPDTNNFRFVRMSANPSSGLILNWNAMAGWGYTLQKSPTLTPATWTNMPSPFVNMSGLGESILYLGVEPDPSMFYRLISTVQE